MRSGPVYIVKPKYIFKHPFNKYDFTSPTNRQTQNEELTDYFNYGFNQDTMNIYGKLVKRFIEVIEPSKYLECFEQASELMRLNDQMCMDFGGFCRFFDPSVVDNKTNEDFHDGQKLMEYFIMTCLAGLSSKRSEYSMIDFIKLMYKKETEEEDGTNTLYDIIEQIGKNLEQKYEETMKLLLEKQQAAKVPKKDMGRGGRDRDHRDHRDRGRDREDRDHRGRRDDFRHDRGDRRDYGRDRDRQRQREREREREKQREREREREKKKESASESEDSDDSGRSKKKKEKRERSREKKKKEKKDRKKDRSNRSESRSKDRHKTKKVKKEKHHRRSRSQEKKKKHH